MSNFHQKFLSEFLKGSFARVAISESNGQTKAFQTPKYCVGMIMQLFPQRFAAVQNDNTLMKAF